MHVPGLGVQDTTHFVVGLKGVLITRVRFQSVEYLDPLVAHTNGQANAIVDDKTGAFKMEPLNRSYSDEYWPGVHSARPMGGSSTQVRVETKCPASSIYNTTENMVLLGLRPQR